MGSHHKVEIRLGLPEALRRDAAELYYEAFRQKLEPLMDSAGHGIAILQAGFDPRYGIAALQEQKLVGVAGIQYGGHHFLNFKRSAFVQEFGWTRGLFKLALIQFASRPHRRGQLLMDGIVVASSMRGQGVGTRLLVAVTDYARQNGFRSVRLDVVDTNPRARRLYERMGFVPTKTRTYPFLRDMLGFSAVTTMIRKVGPDQAGLLEKEAS
jgi:ribosomal protein S18 acetylase RimI-like enzyme